MSNTRTVLTDDDLRMLVKGPTPDERATAAHKLCRAVDREEMSDEDRLRAQEILRLMARDAADLVRRALSITLKSSPVLPNDVAMRLARDLDSIATPVLNFSPVFTDDDLIEIAKTGGPVRQIAIAQRPALSEGVADVLVETGCEEAVRRVCANDNAALSSKTLQKAVERFGDREEVLEAIAYRKVLPLAITEKLIHLVSDQVKQHLVDNYILPTEIAAKLTAGALERATVDLVDQADRTQDIGAFVTHLNRSGRLSASLLLRALAQGHMPFFEWGVAELSGVPHHRTWLMIHDSGPLGLRAIYERTGLPIRLFPAFRAGVDTYRAMTAEGGAPVREKFQERMLQRFLTLPQTAAKEDIDYMMDKLDRLTTVRRMRAGQALALAHAG